MSHKTKTPPKSAAHRPAKPQTEQLSPRDIKELKRLEQRLPTALN